VADSRERALAHLLGALEELAGLFALSLEWLVGRARLCAELRGAEARWRERAPGDPAAARVAEIFGALAEVFEAPPAPRRAARRDTVRKFDPPRTRWDTRARWRS
jgi:hypothetical protein